jgi:23S rRNA (adenine2030-N6)-methyltransferase
MATLHAINPGDALSVAPGSPAIVRSVLGDQDRLIVNELHPAAATALHRWTANDPRVAIHRRDANEALRGLLPPEIRRGLVLVDPSYEERGAYADTARAVAGGVTRWPEGIFATWYPILADRRDKALTEGLAAIDAPMVSSELDFDNRGLADAPALGLRGSGLIVINPPWQFADRAGPLGNALARHLGDGPKAAHRLTWIHPDG